ncbi:MAG: C10 family peptidase [Bacteroidaceae bacterium]|nr:C10 family peptidase [Bacteroidaceae bacterium]
MKKLLVSTLALLSALGINADPISRTEALQIAQEYMVPGYQMSMTNQAQAKLRASSSEYAPYYIISRGANQGFVIVSGDDCLPEVLGVAEQGDFDPDNMPPALLDMLDGWQKIVELAQADGSNVAMAKSRRAQRASTTRVDIPPFVTSHWHQTSPYNDNCPTLTKNGNRALTGCVATAASQILYYWRKDLPSTLQGTTPTYGYGDAPVTRSVPKGTPLKWDLMLDSYGSQSADFKQPVAEFVFATGAATWLTYGESTSGHIENIPYTYSAYFGMNGGTVHYRNSYGQEGWTQLLYNELAAGRPVMYTGVHPDQGGHAVFVHGYRASDDKFYFNFGWGGQADGYYTTTTTDGMNGFYDSQSALIGACPKKWNRTISITLPEHVYTNVENEFAVKVANNSTLDFSGVYLFLSTSKTNPSKLANAKSSDTETLFATGSVQEITLTGKPTSDRLYYVTLTDADLNVLAQTSFTPEKPETALSLKKVTMKGGSDTEDFGGKTYHFVYNTQTSVDVTVTNKADAPYGGTLVMDLSEYDEVANVWVPTGVTYTGQLTVNAHEEADATVTVYSTTAHPIVEGKHYKLQVHEKTQLANDPISLDEAENSDIYLIFQKKDMSVVSFEDNCLTIQGHFDAIAFNSSSFASRKAYNTATLYDLTQCTGVGEVTQSVNPNALVYVAADSKATGKNVVCNGCCKELSLVPGYNFTPRADFIAEKAELNLAVEPARWYLITTPFAANVPDGIIVRDITEHLSAAVRTADVKTLEAGKAYLVMASSTGNMTLAGENVTVVAAPVENTDNALIGTYINTTTPAKAHLLNAEEKQSFVVVKEGSEVEALRGYWNADDTPADVRAYPSITQDPPYITLAQSINEARQILEKYKDVVKESAYEAYEQEIQYAEKEFSNRGEGAELTSISQVKEYAAQLVADGETYMKQIAYLGNREIDFTSNIVNPSFEQSKASPRGWTVGKKEGFTSVGSVNDGTAANDKRAVGLDGTYYYRSLIAADDSSSVSISQVVQGLTPGYYRLTAMLGTDEKSSVTLFADDATATVDGHAFGPLYLSEAVINNIKVTADEGAETGSLTIGVKEGRWYKVDNFTLTYVGMLEEDDPSTGIENLPEKRAGVRKGIYTLQGVRVPAATQSGIYIIDGEKRVK